MRRGVLFSLSLTALLLLAGCHGHRPERSMYDGTPLYDQRGSARSLVLTAPAVQNAQAQPPTYQPWYTDRNDYGPSVVAGYEGPTYSSSVTYTRDSRSIYNGRVRDNFDQTTYRRTYREYTR